jgi:hypothetical protein
VLAASRRRARGGDDARRQDGAAAEVAHDRVATMRYHSVLSACIHPYRTRPGRACYVVPGTTTCAPSPSFIESVFEADVHAARDLADDVRHLLGVL